jgi:hypothetical protein
MRIALNAHRNWESDLRSLVASKLISHDIVYLFFSGTMIET